MSELIQKNEYDNVRRRLLAGASALVLMGYVAAVPAAQAEDSDRPTVWIELGGQLSRLENSRETYAPPFVDLTPSTLVPPQIYERPPSFGFGESLALTFQPKGSDWSFSASVEYGRASSNKHVRHQTYSSGYQRHHPGGTAYDAPQPGLAQRFADTRSEQTDSRTVLDFQAGKDVGLGWLGPNASSSLSVGVRFAQFMTKSRAALEEDPDFKFNPYFYTIVFPGHTRVSQFLRESYHTYAGSFSADRSFHGLGPSLSWKASVPFAGNSHDGELTFDFGMNGALLFGRQKTKTHRQTSAQFHDYQTAYFYRYYRYYNDAQRTTVYDHRPPDNVRSRSVIVPNLGGFAGISFKSDATKVSFGYKADFFFGAMDGGIDVRRTEDVGFHGPYASISIGLGG